MATATKPKIKYTKKQFLLDVAAEATALKEYATAVELNRLNFYRLEPDHSTSCIYGQMTGNCTSFRASELIFNCCKRFIHNSFGCEIYTDGFRVIEENVNGGKIDGVTSSHDLNIARGVNVRYFSSIEAYIFLPGAKSADLIDYLKSYTDNLVL